MCGPVVVMAASTTGTSVARSRAMNRYVDAQAAALVALWSNAA